MLMAKRYYFSVHFTPSSSDMALLTGRCIQQMHLFLVNNPTANGQVGVCLPRWTQSSIGNTVAFVAESKEMLLGLSFQPYFSIMCKEGIFECSKVCQVPDGLPEVRFIRNQTIGKIYVASKNRRMRRCLERAKELGNDYSPGVNEERHFNFFHRIPISSGSSGQDYLLHVQKENAEKRALSHFSSYGLATNQEKRGTVPDLMI